MSTAILDTPIRLSPGTNVRPGLATLVQVELRKMVNTRAGFWLQAAIVAITVVVVIVRSIVGDASDHTFASILYFALWPTAFLLPVAGILLVTSEWSQRTGMITFAQVPVRSRVIGAKLLASIVVAVAMLVTIVAIAAAGALVAGAGRAWTDSVPLIAQSAVYIVAGMVIGVAFGMILLSSGARDRRSLRPADRLVSARITTGDRRRGPMAGHQPRPRAAAAGNPEQHPMGSRRHVTRTLDVASLVDRRLADHPTGGRLVIALSPTAGRDRSFSCALTLDAPDADPQPPDTPPSPGVLAQFVHQSAGGVGRMHLEPSDASARRLFERDIEGPVTMAQPPAISRGGRLHGVLATRVAKPYLRP
jgi:hypothetical protein